MFLRNEEDKTNEKVLGVRHTAGASYKISSTPDNISSQVVFL